MADIVLTTLNAKYIHASFGLRYLLSNLGPYRRQAELIEFDINQRPLDIAESLLRHQPKIIGIGVYIWNITPTTQLVSLLKRLRPEVLIVLGGPEVSYETEGQPIVDLADFVITGEADLAFRDLCGQLLARNLPSTKIIHPTLPQLSDLELPYAAYTDEDLQHRIVYLEASRGCPFTCEFCLSSLDIPVRQVPLDRFLEAMQQLMDRGLRQFKFVDRTFNLNLNVSKAILLFLLERHQPGRFYHFEMIPDRLPAALREIICRFPDGSIQFEVGIQTFNPAVSELISRRQNLDSLADNFQFLRNHTGVHIHADLIVGLPGEDLMSFAAGFDRLIALRPQEIQIGILKRLRGTPIIRHDAEWGMVYADQSPYEVLQTSSVSFEEMQRMRRFARYWDLIGNSGNFVETLTLLWAPGESPFAQFLRASDWLFSRLRRTDQIALVRLYELLFEWLIQEKKGHEDQVAATLWRDFSRGRRIEPPRFLTPYLSPTKAVKVASVAGDTVPKRQARHWATPSATELEGSAPVRLDSGQPPRS